jgi:transposase
MKYYAGIDVSLNSSNVCVVDASGKIVREGKVASEPVTLITWLGSLGVNLERIGLEAGPLSQWLYGALREAGLAVELLETRHVKTALSTMPVKTDRNDARGIAQLMRLGWFRPVHCKSMAAQEVRALLTARKLVQRINHLVDGQTSLEVVAAALLSLHAVALREFKSLEKSVRQISRADARVRLLMSTPGVGPLVALTYVAAIDDPARFTSSKSVGAHFGLTPKKYQSGETDVSGRISKMGDGSVRTALYEAAHVILTRPIKGGALKSWAMKLARRAGMMKAKVALARKLAVVLHRMWVDAIKFDADKASGCARVAA